MDARMIPLLLALWQLPLSGATSDPCSSTWSLDLGRDVSFITHDPSQVARLPCDRGLPQDWYTFPGGDVASTCVPVNHCGSRMTVWMRGTPPSRRDGVVVRHMCISEAASVSDRAACCKLSFPAEVKNCGYKMAYRFNTTTFPCPARFCTERRKLPVPGSPDLLPPKVSRDGHSFSHTCKLPPGLCTSTAPCSVRFLMDGHVVKQVPDVVDAVSRVDGASLWKGHLGQTLTCAVVPDQSSQPIFSNSSYKGELTLSPTRLDLKEGETGTVTATSTLPITCRYGDVNDCELLLELDTNTGIDDLFAVENCSMVLRPSDWDSAKHRAQVSHTVTTRLDPVVRAPVQHTVSYAVSFHPLHNAQGLEAFQGGRITPVQVNVTDQPHSTCSHTTDPNVLGYQSPRSFQHAYTGTYHMHSSQHQYTYTLPLTQSQQSANGSQQTTTSSYNLHVCSHHWQPQGSAAPGLPAAMCGVTVGCGSDAVRISLCHGKPGQTSISITSPRPLSSALVVQQTSKSTYTVHSCHGALVHVTITNIMLNVQVTYAPGTAPGNLTSPNSTCSAPPPPQGTLDLQSALSHRVNPKADLFPANASKAPTFCRCGRSKGAVQCDHFQRINNPAAQVPGRPVTPTVVHDDFYREPAVFTFNVLSDARRRRAAELNTPRTQCLTAVRELVRERCLLYNPGYSDILLDLCLQHPQVPQGLAEVERYLATRGHACLRHSPAARTARAVTVTSSFPTDATAGFVIRPEDQQLQARRWPTSWGLGEAGAVSHCRQAFQTHLSPQCQQLAARMDDFIVMCAHDILNFDSLDYVVYTLSAFNKDCQMKLMADPSNYRKGPDGRLELRAGLVTPDLCENMCSLHGACVGSQCQCQPGFAGLDCSVTRHHFLNVTGVDGGPLCDVSRGGNCYDPVLIVDNAYTLLVENTQGNRAVVELATYFVGAGGLVATGVNRSWDDFPVRVVSKFALIFSPKAVLDLAKLHQALQQGGKARDASALAVELTLKTLDDDNRVARASRPFTYVVYDATCRHCHVSPSGRLQCDLKRDTCLIDGHCYSQGERNPNALGTKCDPPTSKVQWTPFG